MSIEIANNQQHANAISQNFTNSKVVFVELVDCVMVLIFDKE